MNSQLDEVISQIQNWTFLFMILNGKREILISRLIVKRVLYIQWKNIPKKASEPRFSEDRRKVPWNWDYLLKNSE